MTTLSNAPTRQSFLSGVLGALVAAAVGCGGDSASPAPATAGTGAGMDSSAAAGASGMASAGATSVGVAAGTGATMPGEAGAGMPAGPAATWSQIYDMMYPMETNARCNACHANPANDVGNGNLHMGPEKEVAYQALVGKVSSSTRCMQRPLVVPMQPAMSLLMIKLSPNPPCGSRMPIGGTPFTETQLEMVRSWIAAGAKNN
jgi:hypothetical protein